MFGKKKEEVKKEEGMFFVVEKHTQNIHMDYPPPQFAFGRSSQQVPVCYPTLADAMAKAEELAKKRPNTHYSVLGVVGTCASFQPPPELPVWETK